MMTGKLPTEAFEAYVALGEARSYAAVARRFGVTKRAVVNLAKKQDWQARLDRIERDAREQTDRKVAETLEAMNERHLKTIRFVQGKALEALKTMPLGTGMEAVRALDLGLKLERTIRGEPSDRTAVSVEDAIRREYKRWLTPEDGPDKSDEAPSLAAPEDDLEGGRP